MNATVRTFIPPAPLAVSSPHLGNFLHRDAGLRIDRIHDYLTGELATLPPAGESPLTNEEVRAAYEWLKETEPVGKQKLSHQLFDALFALKLKTLSDPIATQLKLLLMESYPFGTSEWRLVMNAVRLLLSDPRTEKRRKAFSVYTHSVWNLANPDIPTAAKRAELEWGFEFLWRHRQDSDPVIRLYALEGLSWCAFGLPDGSPQIELCARLLIDTISNPEADDSLRQRAFEQYGQQNRRYTRAKESLWKEANLLYRLFATRETPPHLRPAAALGYVSLVWNHRMSADYPPLNDHARGAVAIFTDEQESDPVRLAAFRLYSLLVVYFSDRIEPAADEVIWNYVENHPTLETRLLYAQMLQVRPPNETYLDQAIRLARDKIYDPRPYLLLLGVVSPNERIVTREFGALLALLDTSSSSKVIKILIKNFGKFEAFRLWETVAQSPWMQGRGLTPQSLQRLAKLAQQLGSARDRWKVLLQYLAAWDEPRRIILESLLEAEGKAKKTIRALRAVNSIPAALKDAIVSELARQIPTWSAKASTGTTSRALRTIDFIMSRLEQALAEKVRESADRPRSWERHQPLQEALRSTGTLELFMQAALFMGEEGRQILGRLLDELTTAELTDNGIIHWRRYVPLVEQGFHPVFVKRWAQEYRKEWEPAGTAVDLGAARAQVIGQARLQIGTHCKDPKGAPGPFGAHLPAEVQRLLDKLTSGEIDLERDVEPLLTTFDQNYGEIRRQLGDSFANIRTDLINLRHGLRGEAVVAQQTEGIELSGRPEVMARMGHIPERTCQNLLALFSEYTNGNGQPLNRIRLGQFKVANYWVDGTVVARRAVELTRNRQGEAVLIADRLYAAGGFVAAERFKGEIIAYAQGIGIREQNVFFAEAGEKDDLVVLDTRDEIYRDTRFPSIDPAKLLRQTC